MKLMLLLFVLVVGCSSVWADSTPTTLASLINSTTTGWSLSTGGSTGSGTGLYYKLTSSSHYIQSPAITWSDYTNIKIKIKARTYGGVEAAKNKISVSQSSTELTSYTPSSATLTYSDELAISPSSGALKIECKGADGSKGSGISEIIITGVLANTGEETTVIIDATSVVNNMYGDNTNGGTFSATVYDSSDEEIDGAIVTWSSSDETVATINSSTGAVTLKKVGTTTITATYDGEPDVYQSSSETYDLEVVNEDPALITIWSENFSTYNANDVPSGGTYGYVCTNGGGTTKIYTEQSAGGTSPELLVGKSNGTFSATVPLLTSEYGYSGDLILKFKSNDKSINVKSGTSGITVKGEASAGAGVTFNTKGTHTVTFEGTTVDNEDVTIVFTATTSNNVRLDDIVLKGIIAVPLNNDNEIKNDVTIPVGATLRISSELIVPSGKKLTVNGTLENDDPDNLVINDGGQLICSNSVAATVKKSISAATAKTPTNWYGISSSVHKAGQTYEEMGSVTNLLGGTYDMFYYKESESKWINQKATVSPYAAAYTNMESCRGYIYRNAANVVLSYSGETNVGEISQYTLSYTSELTNDALKGINLVGNPYPHKIYKGVAFAVTADTLETGYYTIGGDGACTSTLNSVAIDVNQAVLVKAKSGTNGMKLTFKDRTKAPAAKSNNDNIKFIVSNSQYEDVAYALFDKGAGLDKINHRNADIPMIYIPQDDNNYAIATMGDDTKSFNLNFKAMTMGQYTLQAKTDGNYSYLHIFDRMTGEDIDMLLEGEYSFIASPSDNDTRFIVNLAYNPGSNTVENEIFAYQSGSDIIVNGEGELQVFDVTGRQVMNTTINGVESINIPNQGVYIFKLNEKVQKIVVR